MSVAVRAASAFDIDAVMEVMARAFEPEFGEAWNRGQCLGILSLADVWLSVAEDDEGRALGFALARRMVDEAELLLLAVEPAARGRGIARALIEAAAAEAVRRGAARLLLEVRASNPALALYRGVGFGEIGRRQNYYRGAGGALHDALTLARALATPPPG